MYSRGLFIFKFKKVNLGGDFMKNNFNKNSFLYIFKEIISLEKIISKKEKSLKRDKENLEKLKKIYEKKIMAIFRALGKVS